jgi:general secretion pathway protein D
VTESVLEIRYPTEFRVPEVNVRFDEQNPAATNEPNAPDAKKLPKIVADLTAHGGVPAAFEKRDVGVIFGIEPTINPDGHSVDMQLAPEHVQFLGLNKLTFERKVGSDKSTVEQPAFFTTKVSTNITVKSGSRVMLSYEKVEKPVGNIEIMILQTTIETFGKPVGDPRKK